MSDDPVRLSKLMAERGLCSRREADAMIERGWVMVDGIVVSQLGSKVSPRARITLAAEALQRQKQLVTVMLNKPIGYVSNLPEPGKIPAIRLIKPESQDSRDRRRLVSEDLENLAVAGRLDIDSQGLLLFTQDGRMARRLIGQDSEIEKEYLVRVQGNLSDEGLRQLRHGLSLDGKALKPAKVEWVNEDQLRFVLTEGKKRQIRRMCEAVGLQVKGLKRVRIGHLMLGDLAEGQWRFVTAEDIFKRSRRN